MTRKLFAAVLIALLLSTVATAVAADPTGTWTKKSFSVKGSYRFVEENGRTFLVLDEKFSTKKAPDLKLFLTNRPLAEANGRNAADGAVLIAKLKTNKGGQRYALPEGVDVSEFTTLLLHCERYSKLWAGASLR